MHSARGTTVASCGVMRSCFRSERVFHLVGLAFVALSLSATTGCAVGRIHESSMSQSTAPKYPSFLVQKDSQTQPAHEAVAANESR
ncbi:MAG: hypothetical protein U0174_11455 [Polyangiaceae bacterium]